MKKIFRLKQNYPRPGKIDWIGIRTGQGKEILPVDSAELILDHGIAGDKAGQIIGSKRQVTLIQAEYLPWNKHLVLERLMRCVIMVESMRW